MPCPNCGCKESTVYESRPVKTVALPAHTYRGAGNQRRRECHECRHRWVTHEIAVKALRESEKGHQT